MRRRPAAAEHLGIAVLGELRRRGLLHVDELATGPRPGLVHWTSCADGL
jgi:hypothetical protein